MKKVIAAFLTLALTLCMVPSALAASSEATDAANTLNALGLFSGTGTDANGKPIYDLDRAPTRAEAVTMLVRLLGKEDEAKAGTWTTPFTDVPDWAKPYVGYAYTNNLTSGTGATTFGGSATISATQYITLVLRALGYESGKDFQWDKAWELSDKIGVTDGRYNASNNSFLRGDVAIISNNALSATLKNSDSVLRDTLDLHEAPETNTQGIRLEHFAWDSDPYIIKPQSALFYQKDGQLYKLSSAFTPTFRLFSVNGVRGYYITTGGDGVNAFLPVASGNVTFEKSSNQNFAGEIPYDTRLKYGDDVYTAVAGDWVSMRISGYACDYKMDLVTDKTNPLAETVTTYTYARYNVNGKSLTVDLLSRAPAVDGPYISYVASNIDGVTCIKDDSNIYVNAQELLDHFGVEGTLQIEQDSYGNIIYSVK